MSDDSYGEFRRLVATLKEGEEDVTVTVDLRELSLLIFEHDRLKSYEYHTVVRQKLGVEERWAQGFPHDPRSEKIARGIAKIDYEQCSDSMCLKFGGDGDNGETMLYLLDVYFEETGEPTIEELQIKIEKLEKERDLLGYMAAENEGKFKALRARAMDAEDRVKELEADIAAPQPTFCKTVMCEQYRQVGSEFCSDHHPGLW